MAFSRRFRSVHNNGRNGSNACVFISLYLGQVVSKGLLPPKRGLSLNVKWKDAPEAISCRNDLHDELFDQKGINLNVDDAVEMAGEDCSVLSSWTTKRFIQWYWCCKAVTC